MDAVSRSVIDRVTAVVEYDYTAKECDELDLVKGAIIYNIKRLPGGWWEGTLKSTGKTGMFPDNFVRLVDTSDENGVVLRDKSTVTNRRCKVIYSYTQVNDDELSLTVGDVIELLGEVEEGWWRGSLKNKVGVFPSNFVVTIEPSPIFASKRPPSANAATTAAASSLKLAATATSSSTSSNAATSSTTSNSVNVSTVASSSKKLNRPSLHSSKEDLLSSTHNNKIETATTTPGDDAAPSLPPKPQREFCRVEFPYMPQNEDELYLRAGDIITIISMELPDKGWWKGELRGKVGVFPDNFVKLLPPEAIPINDAHFTNRVKSSITTSDTASTSTATSASQLNILSSATKTNHVNNSKVFVKKSGSSSSTHSSQGQAVKRKDSFGSRDSLNDILSETGLQSGNVAAARKSLENKNIDLLNVPEASRLTMKKAQQETAPTTGAVVVCSSANLSASTIGSNSEIRKSFENLEEKTKTQPPVLSKKPILCAKGILSGLKQKVKNVEKQLSTAAIHDYTDGVAGSKTSPSSSGLPDAGVAGNVILRRSATIAVEDIDFDSVERASILPDMRAGRVKAPRRRPPSVAYNVTGESNNNNTAYLNGSCGDAVPEELLKLHSSDENSTGDEQLLAKPKPREWQTQKAPWMEELKLTQVKKKASPNVEPHSVAPTTNETEIKVLAEEPSISSSSPRAFSSSTSSSSSVRITTNKVQSSSVSTAMNQSVSVESHEQQMSESVMVTKSSLDTTEDTRMRPNSLSIRNCSSSPSAMAMGRKSGKSIGMHDSSGINVAMEAASKNANLVSSNATLLTNSHSATSSSVQENNSSTYVKHSETLSNAISNDSKADTTRVSELEQRIEKLESAVLAQQRAIDELVCTLREESDRVKLLRGELDKYAQCVTQV